MEYVIITEEGFNGEYSRIERHDEDGTIWGIPEDPENTDYQEYLAWLEENK